jgi:polyisoprenoid-binding protein YceI
MFRSASRWILLSVGLAVVACSPAASTPSAATAAPPTSTVATSAATATGAIPDAKPATPAAEAYPSPAAVSSAPLTPVGAPYPSPETAATPVSPTTSAINLRIAPDGSSATYRVREQLASKSLPSDSVGTTKKITGGLVLDANGKIDSVKSKIVVDLTSLQSDSDRRDGFIQRGVLETNNFPTAEFHPTETQGLPSPLPTSGTVQFKLAGSMTIHGTSKPMVWDVTAQVAGSDVTGHALTSFTWADYGLSKPRVSVVLSVEDTVKLDVTLHLIPAA